jgi:hypothetical protein
MNKVPLHLTSCTFPTVCLEKGVFLELLIPKDSVPEPSFLPPNHFSIKLYSGTMNMEAVCLSEMLERIFTTRYENPLKKQASLASLD